MASVAIDTCVLMDVFLTSRPRHALAEELRKLIKAADVRVLVPMHGIFEISSATRQEKIAAKGKVEFSTAIPIGDGFAMHAIPIDEAFVQKYLSPDLPYLHSGDLIYVALAKGEGIDLVTEDDKVYKRAKEAGVQTYRIKEYIGKLVRGG